MSDDFRRRRRLNTGGAPRRSGGSRDGGVNPWVITIFAALVVIAGGWFLGQALARVFNGPPRNEKVAQAPTPVPVVTPVASASPAATTAATAKPSPTAQPTRTVKPKPTPEPSPTATVKVITAPSETAAPSPAATQAATAAPSPAPTGTPAQTRHTEPIARRPESAAPAPAEGTDPATRLVRAYIEALRNSDPSTASTYLANGVPDESFIDSGTRISNISSTRNSDGSYKVSVDMQTSKGEYYETFTVASDRILDKTAIKP